MADVNLNQLAARIAALPKKDHEPIYYLLKQDDVKITVSNTNVLFLASHCPAETLRKINNIVNTCYENLNNEKKYEQEYKSIRSEIVRTNIEANENGSVPFKKSDIVEMNYYNRSKLDKMKKQDQERQAKNKNIRQTIQFKRTGDN